MFMFGVGMNNNNGNIAFIDEYLTLSMTLSKSETGKKFYGY